jgi:hypothetical protein
MRVNFYLSGDKHRDFVIQSLFEGCPEQKTLVPHDGAYSPSDVAVVFGIFKKAVKQSWFRGRVIEEQKKAGKPTIILETGYIHRGDGQDNYYAVGLNGMNGRAEFFNHNSPPDRAHKLGIAMKPWRSFGHYVLLCGQVPWDSSVDFTDHVDWLKKTATNIADKGRLVLFRGHPLAPVISMPDAMTSVKPNIEQDLDGAWCHVAYNSNSGVDAILNGIPSISFDRYSMVWDVSGHDLRALDSPVIVDRQQWLNNIAQAQWTPHEMSLGLPWKHLFERENANLISEA